MTGPARRRTLPNNGQVRTTPRGSGRKAWENADRKHCDSLCDTPAGGGIAPGDRRGRRPGYIHHEVVYLAALTWTDAVMWASDLWRWIFQRPPGSCGVTQSILPTRSPSAPQTPQILPRARDGALSEASSSDARVSRVRRRLASRFFVCWWYSAGTPLTCGIWQPLGPRQDHWPGMVRILTDADLGAYGSVGLPVVARSELPVPPGTGRQNRLLTSTWSNSTPFTPVRSWWFRCVDAVGDTDVTEVAPRRPAGPLTRR